MLNDRSFDFALVTAIAALSLIAAAVWESVFFMAVTALFIVGAVAIAYREFRGE